MRTCELMLSVISNTHNELNMFCFYFCFLCFFFFHLQCVYWQYNKTNKITDQLLAMLFFYYISTLIARILTKTKYLLVSYTTYNSYVIHMNIWKINHKCIIMTYLLLTRYLHSFNLRYIHRFLPLTMMTNAWQSFGDLSQSKNYSINPVR